METSRTCYDLAYLCEGCSASLSIGAGLRIHLGCDYEKHRSRLAPNATAVPAENKEEGKGEGE